VGVKTPTLDFSVIDDIPAAAMVVSFSGFTPPVYKLKKALLIIFI
jgi:hypothetical protein